MQFWIVSLLDVSLLPVRVGGSPLSLKHPKFPGTVEMEREMREKARFGHVLVGIHDDDEQSLLYEDNNEKVKFLASHLNAER